MLPEEEINEAFENNSDCYADTRKHQYDEEDIVVMAMTKGKFAEVVKELLAQPEAVKRGVSEEYCNDGYYENKIGELKNDLTIKTTSNVV